MKMFVPGLTLLLSVTALFQGCGGRVNEDPMELPKSASKIYISEYMASGRWVEICNPTDSTIDIRGYLLIVDGRRRQPYKNEIEAGECMIFSDIKGIEEATEFYLKDADGALVDIVSNPKHKKYKSVTRRPLGDGTFIERNEENISPGFPNTPEGQRAYKASRRKKNDTGVYVSEIMVDNESAYQDPDGEFVDYIEIHNSSDKTVDISGWGLTDKEVAPHLFKFPAKTKLEPGEYLVVNCSSTYKENAEGPFLMAPFNISNGEDWVYLSNREGYILWEYGPVSTMEDQSLISRDGKVFIGTFSVSPGYSNDAAGAAEYALSRTSEGLGDLFIAEALPGTENNSGWLELVNRGSAPISLDGYTLADDKPLEHLYTFPDRTIPAGGRLLIYADATGKPLAAGYSFRKSALLELCDKDGNTIDLIGLSDIPAGMSKGRDGKSASWQYYRAPTPGAINAGGVKELAIAPIASVPSGQYDDIDELVVEFYADGEIRYTTDGSAPTASSRKYTGPFHLDQTSVIRAMTIRDGAVSSPVSSWTFLVNEGHTMDVVSLVSAPEGLFSTGSGIYSQGPYRLLPPGETEGDGLVYPYVGANYWKKWVRQSNLTFLPKYGAGFSYDCGASIFGGYSRMNSKKSMKFKFKRQYGTPKLNYKLFPNRDFSEFDCIVMRTGGQDAYGTLIKDDLTSVLMDDLIDNMATRPVVYYINGEYYGVYFLREKVNRHFIASHYGVPTDHIDIIQGNAHCEAGSIKDWNNFLNFIKSHDMSVAENYKWVEDRMDIQSFIDWIICETYVGNTDAGNVRTFRSPNIDNKWHWLLYDVDISMSGPRAEGFMVYWKPTQQKICQTDVIRGLMKNRSFRALFLERLEFQMHNIWNRDNVNAAIDRFVEIMDGEMPRNQKRWGTNTYQTWVNRINGLHKYANERQAYLREMFGTNALLKSIVHMTPEELDRCFEK